MERVTTEKPDKHYLRQGIKVDVNNVISHVDSMYLLYVMTLALLGSFSPKLMTPVFI